VKPYRVGMSCGLCHVGPNPINPPADPNNPEWANLSSNVGAQYFWTDRIFYEAADYSSFAFQLFHASRPGSLDTSFVSTDNINNPRTMNAVYGLLPRLLNARRWGKETLTGGGRNNKQFNDYLKDGPLAALFTAPDTVWTPRVLKDGSDSVGAMGALNRVYLNIGAFSEEWLRHFNPLVGGKPITPIDHRLGPHALGLLRRHRSADLRHGEVLPEDDRPAQAGRRPGRRRPAHGRRARCSRAARRSSPRRAPAATRRSCPSSSTRCCPRAAWGRTT
jgi:hypothetical protein